MKFSLISVPVILKLLLTIPLSDAYKPVVLLHGILSDAASMTIIGDQIRAVRKTSNCYLIVDVKTFPSEPSGD